MQITAFFFQLMLFIFQSLSFSACARIIWTIGARVYRRFTLSSPVIMVCYVCRIKIDINLFIVSKIK